MNMTSIIFKKKVAWLRSFATFSVVSAAQLLFPAVAADPAAKIDPPAWSHRHSREEVRAYRAHANGENPEQKDVQRIGKLKLRRMLLPRRIEKE